MCLALVKQFNGQKRPPRIFHPVETKREKQRRIDATLFRLEVFAGHIYIDVSFDAHYKNLLCGCRIEKSVPRFAVWHHEACRVMTNGDPE